nr:hypothetical protein [Bacillus pumilus]
MRPEWVERELLDFGVHITNGPMTSDRTLVALFSEASVLRLLEAEKEAMHAPNVAVATVDVFKALCLLSRQFLFVHDDAV